MWCAKVMPFLGNKLLNVIGTKSIRSCDPVQVLDRVIRSLIFPGSKAIDHNKCANRKADESLTVHSC